MPAFIDNIPVHPYTGENNDDSEGLHVGTQGLYPGHDGALMRRWSISYPGNTQGAFYLLDLPAIRTERWWEPGAGECIPDPDDPRWRPTR